MGYAIRLKLKNWVITTATAVASTIAVSGRVSYAQRMVINGAAVATTDLATDSDDLSKTTGFSIKKVDQKVIEQLEDFERFREKKAWDRAFKSLDNYFNAAADSDSMAPTKEGFWIPARQKFLRTLISLSPEGKEAFRLFNDAKAKQQWEQVLAHEAAGDADTLTQLKKTVDQFFVTSIGDLAADHLGDAEFEAGDFNGAAKIWNQVLQYYPESSLSPLRLKIKEATALSRAGRWEQLIEFSNSIKEKHAGETVKVAGKSLSVEEVLVSLARPNLQSTTSPVSNHVEHTPAIELPRGDHPAWQMEFLDSSLSEKLYSMVNQNGWGFQMGPMMRVIPSAVSDGKRVYLIWYGILWALDLESGKIVWWSDHFKKIGDKFSELMQWQVDANRFSLALAGDSLLVVSINLDRMNNQEPFRLMSFDPATGRKKWSSDTGALQNWAFIGTPLVVDSTIYITAHPKDNQEIHVLAVALDGKFLWSSKVGQPQIGNNWRGMPVYPLPVLQYSGGILYILTNNGALIAFDTISRSVNWAFSFERPIGQDANSGRFNYNNQVESNEPIASAWMREGLLYFKERGANTMFALDMAGPDLKWKRDVGTNTGIVGFDDKSFFLLSTGQDNTSLNAVDLQSGKMVLSSKLPDGNEDLQVIRSGTRFLVFLSRGIFAVDSATADVTRNTHSFRGHDKDSMGGGLLQVGDKLISISNLAVTAYAVKKSGAGN